MGREHSIHNPKVRQAVLDLCEAVDPDTDGTMRSIRSLLINKSILDDPSMGVIYTGAAIGILLRICAEDPQATEMLRRYAAKTREVDARHGYQPD